MGQYRYYPVILGRYIGDYSSRPSSLCWAIADSARANHTGGEKYDTREQAQKVADAMNASLGFQRENL